jgi:superfamily II DNA or RNA helicase
MSIIVNGADAKVHWLTNNHSIGRLTKDQGILYVTKDNKLGKATAESYAGLTPAQAFERRYGGMKSAMTSNFIATDFYVFDKSATTDADPDDSVRLLTNSLHSKKKVPFSANVGSRQEENTNSEALISYDRENHLGILTEVVKQYLNLEMFFDTKDPIIWRFKQEDDIEEIFERLIQYRLCLYAAYTSRGKTKIGIEVAVRLCQQGGIVLVTTPITDTKKSFEENINDFHFGNDRNLKVAYMDSTEFAKHSVTELRQRADKGELIFIVLTVQDLRYGEDASINVDSDTKELRAKYHALSGNVNLWIRDERHAQYGGEVTSQRLANMTAEYELDLTATPYNVLDKYNWEQIVSRTLLWGLKYKEHTKLPTICIDAVSTPLSNVSPKIAAMYSEEEGFDPRKLVVRINRKFALESEWLELRDRMYHSPLSKKKNPLSIVNDTELSSVAKNCGFWVLPEGQDGDGAADYIPDLAALLNTNSKTYFTDSYTLEKECPKTTTIGKYIESLVKKHDRVIILTCGKFLTGTDIPVLGHIVLMAKMNNIANFEQLLGRMIREYPGKDEVKMYCFAPAMIIGLVMGEMAKKNVALNGGSDYEMLECIPLTEYTTNGPRKISPDAILAEVQEFFKRLSKDRLPSAPLETRLAGMDLSAWEGKDTKKFKKSAPKAGVTEDNGAKVKNKLGDNPKTGKPYTKDELTTITQIANAIQTVMVEAKWIAYSIDNYDYSVVLNNPALIKMFPDEIDAVIDTIENDAVIKDMVVKNLNDKQLAYKGLLPIEVYDDIFMNNDHKQSIGLVYVPFSMATILVDKIPKNKYNKEGVNILVYNALSGTVPLLLKEKFPKANIICAEYFDYFKDHLIRLGFEVVDCFSADDNKIKIGIDMKFDVVIGNPPYQAPKKGDYSFWARFVDGGHKSLNDHDGYMSMIIPAGWMSPTNDIRQGQRSVMRDIFAKENTSYINIDPDLGKTHFPGIGQKFTWFVLEKGQYISTKIDFGNSIINVDLSKMSMLAKDTDSVNIGILSKLCANPVKWEFTRYIMKESWNEVIFDPLPNHLPRINGNSNHLDKIVYSTNKCKYHDNKKVVLPYNGSDYKFVVDDSSMGCTNAYVMILSKLDLIDSAITYFTHPLLQWLGKNKFTQYNEGALINSVSKIDLTKVVTISDVYQLYNLTPEEIKYVEANVK